MGVSGASAVLYALSGLVLEHLVKAAKLLQERRGLNRPITVAIDASWAGIKSGPRDAVEYTIDVLKPLLAKWNPRPCCA